MTFEKTQTSQKLIAIAAGKGGVGKSSVTVQLARILQAQGFKVGVIDADIYGPSVRKMLPEDRLPYQEGEKIHPAMSAGIPYISLAFFKKENEPTIVRAPIANSIIEQFLCQILWPELDILLVDFPPGTGDVQLTMMQKVSFTGALLVSTPQQVALLDVEKAYEMFEQMKVPVFGIIENMAYFKDSQTGVIYYPFGTSNVEAFAQRKNTTLLGQIPLDVAMSEACDKGVGLLKYFQDSDCVQALEKIAYQLQNANNLQLELPLHITIENERALKVVWSDERIDEFSMATLQRSCPCTLCRDEKSGAFLKNKLDIADDLKAIKFEPVGSYAIKIFFEKGCSHGIYTYTWLHYIGNLIRASTRVHVGNKTW